MLRGFIYGMLFMALITCGVFANPVAREIIFGVRVSLDGEMLEFDDEFRPFIMNDRTFLPVRTIAEALGLDVGFSDGVVTLSTDSNRGDWDGNIYYNEFLGLSFTLPENWTVTSETRMSATSPLGASVQIMYEPQSQPQTALQVMERMANAESASMNVEFNLDFPETVIIGSNEWYFYQTAMTMQILEMDLNVFGHHFINVQDGFERVITIITSDISESAEDILAMFGGI